MLFLFVFGFHFSRARLHRPMQMFRSRLVKFRCGLNLHGVNL